MNFSFEMKNIHGKKRLITHFADKRCLCLEDVLNTEEGFAESILQSIDAVLSQKQERDKLGNERCAIDIQRDTTELYDMLDHLLAPQELYPSLHIPTPALKEFLLSWIKSKEDFLKGKQ